MNLADAAEEKSENLFCSICRDSFAGVCIVYSDRLRRDAYVSKSSCCELK